MRLHPRYHPVRQASFELSTAVSKIIEDHELTPGELIQILTEETATAAKYMIRYERHPDDPEKKGGEE